MRAPLILAGALVLGLAIAMVVGARRVRSPYALARRLDGGAVVVDRHRTEASVRDELLGSLRSEPINVVGTDCRSLQLLVKVAAEEGLEVRDPGGFVARASRRLIDAQGWRRERSGLHLRWAVAVERSTVDLTDGWLMRQTGSDEGCLLSFAPGTAMLLRDGDCLV